MKKLTGVLLLFFTFTINLNAQCISGDCKNGRGVYLYEDKSRYEGMWRNEKPNGKGKIYFSSGSVFDGTFQDGVKSGFGKYQYKSNAYYEGYFKNDDYEGEGKFVTEDGNTFEGLYKSGKLNGYGTITMKNGNKYIGSIANNLPEGVGKYYYSSGDRFEGNFLKGIRNGAGILYYSKGGTLKGLWVDGEFVSGSNNKTNFDSTSISFVKIAAGVYEVPIVINDVLKIDIIFDTGASEVYLTPDIILTLIRTKTINEDDILEGKKFIDANGNINLSLRFNLREIRIGNYIVKNIPCGVSQTTQGISLLGLSAISKLGKIQIDFAESTLKVVR
jgi:hypothetical protein